MSAPALTAGCAVVLLIPIATRIVRRRLDPFEPIVLFAIAWGVMFVVRPASTLVKNETRFWGVNIAETLPRALLLALVGAASFVFVYESRYGRRMARHLPAPGVLDERAAAAAAIGFAALALIVLVILLPASDPRESARILLGGRSHELGALLRESSTYLWYGSLTAAPAALVLGGLTLRHRTPPLIGAFAAVLALALVRVVPVGGRVVLLPLVGGLFVLIYVMRDRRPTAPMLLAVALLALLGSFLTLSVRDPTDSVTLRSSISELRDRPQALLDPVLRDADAEMVLALSAALTEIPESLPHRWGRATVIDLISRPVPREIWSGKPLPPGEVVVSTIWPELYPGLNPAFSPLLSLYWDFSFVGVALGMGLFGLVARALYEWFLRYRNDLSAQLVFSVSVWFVVIGARNNPVDTIVLAAFLVGPVAAIIALSTRGTAPTPAGSKVAT